MTFDFQALLAYIEHLKPGFRQTVTGVPRQVLEAWQDRYSIELPSLYLDFMTVIGHSSGGYYPLGFYNHEFQELASQAEWMHSEDCPYRKDYPQQRYFMIGYVVDQSVLSPHELFLDLERSDGFDAPLIEMGSNGVYTPEGRDDLEKTLGDLLIESAYLQFGKKKGIMFNPS